MKSTEMTQISASLPAHYPGRNLPDVSFNADPYTGYIILYTSDVNGPEVLAGGGTSFVAPQLNGVTALLSQSLHGARLGLLNYPLYALSLTGQAYKGSHAPLHVITMATTGSTRAATAIAPPRASAPWTSLTSRNSCATCSNSLAQAGTAKTPRRKSWGSFYFHLQPFPLLSKSLCVTHMASPHPIDSFAIKELRMSAEASPQKENASNHTGR